MCHSPHRGHWYGKSATPARPRCLMIARLVFAADRKLDGGSTNRTRGRTSTRSLPSRWPSSAPSPSGAGGVARMALKPCLDCGRITAPAARHAGAPARISSRHGGSSPSSSSLATDRAASAAPLARSSWRITSCSALRVAPTTRQTSRPAARVATREPTRHDGARGVREVLGSCERSRRAPRTGSAVRARDRRIRRRRGHREASYQRCSRGATAAGQHR